jgi:transcriptional regulator with XRE-family HTH domain
MERYINLKSPLTGGKVKEICTTEEKVFRKEKFIVHVRYCICEDTGEQFTTTEQDTLQFNDLYSQYRIRHGIPFPDEIKDIRLRYGLNYSQISRILGFGANQYAKYEAGEVPSESNGKMIATIKNKDVLLSLLSGCKDNFQASEYERISTSIRMSEFKEDSNSCLFTVIFNNDKRTIFNGYGYKNIPKLFDMVLYIVTKHGEVFPTKLNKLMFYSDFYNYRKSGLSISGLQYCALNYGPVPEHYATIYDNTPHLEKKLIDAHNMVSTLLTCSVTSDFASLASTEKESIDYVIMKIKSMSVSEIIAASHNESAWQIGVKNHSYIPYDEAFNLKLV